MEQKIFEIIDAVTDASLETDIGLFTGDSGLAIFYFYCSELIDKSYASKCEAKLVEVIEKIEKGEPLKTFCSGLAGFGWTLEFLRERGFCKDEDIELLEDIDPILFNEMMSDLRNSDYDFLHGALGHGMYFLKRLRFVKSKFVLSQLVLELERLAETSNNGTIRWSASSPFDPNLKKRVYNLGLSHGIASIIGVLTKIYKAGIEVEKCHKLVNGAISYLLSQEIDKDKYGSYFTSFSLESYDKIQQSPLSWCYGDLGISMVIFQAGRVFRRKDWVDKSMEVLLFASNNRSFQPNDAGFCHGTAGIAHIFYRMFVQTMHNNFLDASSFWFQKTLEEGYHDGGLAGFKAFRQQNGEAWEKEIGLLEGASGAGLAMMAFHYKINPIWDEFLLLS